MTRVSARTDDGRTAVTKRAQVSETASARRAGSVRRDASPLRCARAREVPLGAAIDSERRPAHMAGRRTEGQCSNVSLSAAASALVWSFAMAASASTTRVQASGSGLAGGARL
jgi:hypothetical protein